MTILGASLLSCSEARSPEVNPSPSLGYDSSGYGSSGPIARTPLAPPAGYVPRPGFDNAPPPTAYEDPINEGAEPVGKWQASPRWSAVQGDGCIVVDQGATGNVDVENCPRNQEPDDLAPAGCY
jgi:hypothetical protein